MTPKSMTLVQELKRCPFCGGEATLIDGRGSQSPPFYVMCKNRLEDEPCHCEMWPVDSPEEAIKRWNHRAFADKLEGEEMVEKIAEALWYSSISREENSWKWLVPNGGVQQRYFKKAKAVLAVVIQQIKGE